MSDSTGMVHKAVYDRAIREAAALEQMLMYLLIENGQQYVGKALIESVDLRDYEFQRIDAGTRFFFRCVKIRESEKPDE